MTYDIPTESVLVTCDFDPTSTGVDSRGNVIPTPYTMTIACPEGFATYAESICAWLLRRYGWRGTVTTTPIWKEEG